MIEFYTVLAVFVLFMVIRALRRKGTPAAGTAAGGGTPRWYQQVSPGTGLTVALWLIGAALVWLVAIKYWRIETGVVWGEWLSSRENLWITILSLALLVGIIAKAVLFRREHAGSVYEGEKKRPSVGGVFSAFVGLAFLVALVALAGLLVLKAWHEFEFGLSNAPERMALRGYVPRESVSAALAAAQPALPEVQSVTAPPLGAGGQTNWSEPLHAIAGYPHMGLSVASAAESQWIRKRVDGVIYPFDQRIPVEGHIFEFCSLTNVPIKVKARGVSEAEKKMTDG